MTLSHSVNPNNHFFGGHHNYARAPDMQGGSYHTLSAVHSPPQHTMHISNRCFVENPPNEWFSSGAHDHHHYHEVGSYYHHVGPYNEAYGEYENGHSPKKTIGVTGTPMKKKTVGTPKTLGTPWKGDWSCPHCEVCNFARNKHCRNCRTQKPEKKVKRNKPNNESKDWICQNCEDTMFAYRKVCRRCNTPRGEVPSDAILSQLPPDQTFSPPPAFESSKTTLTPMHIEENDEVDKKMPRKIKCNAAEGEGACVKKKIAWDEPYYLKLSLGPQKPPLQPEQDCCQSSEGSTCDTSGEPHTQLDTTRDADSSYSSTTLSSNLSVVIQSNTTTSDDEYVTHARVAEALEYTEESHCCFGASERMGCRPAGHDTMGLVLEAESDDDDDDEVVRRSTSTRALSPMGGEWESSLGEPRVLSAGRGIRAEETLGLFNCKDRDDDGDDSHDPQLVASILRMLECFSAEVL